MRKGSSRNPSALAVCSIACLLASCIAGAPRAFAAGSETYTVTSTSSAETGCVGAGGGNEPSLWCAITDADAAPTADSKKIVFTASGTFSPAASDVWPAVSASNLLIDGYGNTCATGANTQSIKTLDGSHPDNATIKVQLDRGSGSFAPALDLTGANQTVCGLSITHFSAGITIDTGAAATHVQGNFLGLAADGTTVGGNQVDISITSGGNSGLVIGGTTPAAINLLANAQSGVVFATPNTTAGSDQIEGNVFGLTASLGAAAYGEGADISNFGALARNLTVGGTAAGAGNIIGLSTGNAINVDGPSSGLTILGNAIGTTFTGVAGGQLTGIRLVNNAGAVLGAANDTAGTAANIITNSQSNGALVGGSFADQVRLTSFRNSIYGNGTACTDASCIDTTKQEIFLNGRSVLHCATAGGIQPNAGVPCPAITSATSSAISGTACSGCTVDVYIATGGFTDQNHGGGRQWLGEVTAAGGTWTLTSANFATPFDPSQQPATATATDSTGNTSEFAANVGQSSATFTTGTLADSSPQTPCQTSSGAFTTSRSLRCALAEANGGANNTVHFGAPGIYTVTNTGETPLYGSGLLVDGYGSSCSTGANSQAISGMDATHGDTATITHQVDASNLFHGFIVEGVNETICGLSVTHFQRAGILADSAASGLTVKGNFIGLAPDGVTAAGNGDGVQVNEGAAGVVVGGTSAAAVNVISGNTLGVAFTSVSGSTPGSGNAVEGNVMGPGSSLGSAVTNGDAVDVNGVPNVTVGGSAAGAGNILGDNTGFGIDTQSASGLQVLNNAIGTNFGQTVTLSNRLAGALFNVGSTGTVKGNIVTANGNAGIRVGGNAGDSAAMDITQNSIFGNNLSGCSTASPCLGIDLGPGNTVNCTGPQAGAPDEYTPCPLINVVSSAVSVTGTACDGCTVEVYIAAPNPGGGTHGEGRTFLGSAVAGAACGSPPCSNNGHAWTLNSVSCAGSNCTYPSGAVLHLLDRVTATATQPGSSPETSEFAANRLVSGVTATHLASISAVRHHGELTVRWRLALARGVLGFLLFAGRERLTAHLIPVHRAPTYLYRTRRPAAPPIMLQTVLRNGHTERMRVG